MAYTTSQSIHKDLLPVDPAPYATVTVTVVAGGTVYYADSTALSASQNQGSLTVGQAVTVTHPIWLLSDSESDVSLAYADSPLPAGQLSSVVGSDGKIGGPGTVGLTGAAMTGSGPVASSPLRVTVGVAPPASPTANDLWMSTSAADLRPPTGAAGRHRLFNGGEPNAYIDATNWNIIYTGGGGLKWATCPLTADPTVAANWTLHGTVLATGSGPGAGAFGAHGGTYYEAGTVYIYYPDQSGFGAVVGNNVTGNVFVASGATPASLSVQTAAVLTGNATGMQPINIRVLKLATNSYVMTFSWGSGAGPQWLAGYATGASPLGPFAIQTASLTTLFPVANSSCVDSPAMRLEGTTVVGWYHSCAVAGSGGFPSDVWRATAPVANLANWTILDNGAPVLQRCASYDSAQIADVTLCDSPTGVTYAFHSAYNTGANQVGQTVITPLSPLLKRYDGFSWREMITETPKFSVPGSNGVITDAPYLSGLAGNELFGAGAGMNLIPIPATPAGVGNTALGHRALNMSVTGYYNVAVGSNSMQVMLAGYQNVGVGWGTFAAATTAASNVAVGYAALLVATTANSNVAIGATAMAATTTGSSNVAVGLSALAAQTTGTSNTAVGASSMLAATTATNSVAVGKSALAAVTTASGNTAIGNGTLFLATGANNTAVGAIAMQSTTTGANNTSLGYQSGYSITTGSYNTAVGYITYAGTTGSVNTALGYSAGNTDGTTTSDGTQSSMTLIGERAQATTSNVIVLGKAVATRPNLIFGGVGAAAAFGGGVGVFAIANAVTNPAGTPTGGGVLYVNAGALTYKGSSGTVTVLGAA